MNVAVAQTGNAAAGVVMAAGRGTRFASDVPKVMHRVADRPMLAHVVETGHAAGLDPLVVVIQPGMDVGAAADGAVTVEQPPDGRGTAYARGNRSWRPSPIRRRGRRALRRFAPGASVHGARRCERPAERRWRCGHLLGGCP